MGNDTSKPNYTYEEVQTYIAMKNKIKQQEEVKIRLQQKRKMKEFDELKAEIEEDN